MKNPQYCHLTVTTVLSAFCDNIVHHVVKFHNTVTNVNCMWSQYCELSTMLWPHTAKIYVNHIVELDNMVNNIVNILWQYFGKNAKAGDVLVISWNMLIFHQNLEILTYFFVTYFWISQRALPKSSQLVNFRLPARINISE